MGTFESMWRTKQCLTKKRLSSRVVGGTCHVFMSNKVDEVGFLISDTNIHWATTVGFLLVIVILD